MNVKKNLPTDRRRVERGGWSLFELVIVITIAGIIATLSISYMIAAIPHAELERSELELARTLREARNHAISQEIPTKVVFSLDDDAVFWIEEFDRGTNTWDEITAQRELSGNVEFAEDGVDFPDTEVNFTVRGTMMAGGTITIKSSEGETTVLTGDVVTGRFILAEGNLR